MFDFLKCKKQDEYQDQQDSDIGRTVPLVPASDDPLKGPAEFPVPAWNGGVSDSHDGETWHGPLAGSHEIPMEMPAGIPAMPADQEAFDDMRPELTGIPPWARDECEADMFTVGLPPYGVEGDQFVRVDSYTGPSLVGVKGVLAGMKLTFRSSVSVLGVDYGCDIVLPLGTPGISRNHLRFWLDGTTPCAMDLKSTYGSLLNGETMKPGLVYNLKSGDLLKLGGDEEFLVE